MSTNHTRSITFSRAILERALNSGLGVLTVIYIEDKGMTYEITYSSPKLNNDDVL